MLGLIHDIHEDPDQVVAIRLALVPPQPRIVCVSVDTAPNCCSKSSRVSAARSSGTGWPSLNRSGSRIS
jgi:hypothetical protein